MIHHTPPEAELIKQLHIQVTCFECGRGTKVLTDNAIGMTFKCLKCGSKGFYRVVIPE